MRRRAWMVGLGCASIALTSLCGCTWEEIFPSNSPSLPNAIAVDRALHLCSLTEGDQPFHLVLEIAQPAHTSPSSRSTALRVQSASVQNSSLARTAGPPLQSTQARVEIFWMNAITYRIVIRSSAFSQTRIVNGNVVEEHDVGDFYPRWIQNFVDALLDPIPKASALRKIPGAVPVGVQSHACISTPTTTRNSPDKSSIAQICFQDADPKIASGNDFTRSVWFDNYAPFGPQLIARTLVNDLPANMLVRGEIMLLEPLRKQDYNLLKAREFTPQERQIRTALVSEDTAEAMLEFPELQPWFAQGSGNAETQTGARLTVYIRTDRTGRVREAYRDTSDQFGLQDAAVARALTLHFIPLIVDGAPRQMEAPILLPSRTTALPGTSH